MRSTVVRKLLRELTTQDDRTPPRRNVVRIVDDLSGKEVGWVTGYATEGLEEIEQKLGEKRLEPLRRVAFSTEADALGALRAGGVDAVILANVQGDFYVSKQPGSFEVVRGIQVFTRKFGFGVSRR